MDAILLIGNDTEFLDSIKGYLNKSFSMKYLSEDAYILGINIYKHRSRRLIGLSQSTYLDKVLKKFKMDQAKKGFLPVLQGVKLSQTQCPSTAEDRKSFPVTPPIHSYTNHTSNVYDQDQELTGRYHNTTLDIN